MTFSSGAPYTVHGQPRVPNQPQPQVAYPMHTNYLQDRQVVNNGGFTTATLTVPPQNTPAAGAATATVLPMQPIRPIQPVQGIPQNLNQQSGSPSGGSGAGAPIGGVSFAPGGKTGTGGAGYVQQMNPPGGSHGGSMESLNSTISSTLSFGSTISTGMLQSGAKRLAVFTYSHFNPAKLRFNTVTFGCDSLLNRYVHYLIQLAILAELAVNPASHFNPAILNCKTQDITAKLRFYTVTFGGNLLHKTLLF